METIRLILLSFGGIFTFAFGLAWILPLMIAGQEELAKKKGSEVVLFMDLLLLAFDCIPIFWAFRALSEAPSTLREARALWKSERSIRSMFWLSMIALTVTILSAVWPA